MWRALRGVTKARVAIQASSESAIMPSRLKKTKLLYAPKQMFALEESLPPLPVPPLQQTMERYLLSLQPLLDKHSFSCSEQVVNDFRKPGGIGEQLQEKLVKKAKSSDNWIAESWDNVGYFEYRNPVVVFSSPGIHFPKQDFICQEDQLKYTARLIKSVIFMKDMINSESIPVDMLGKNPMTMIQYKKLLSTCRIPDMPRDYSRSASEEESQHFVVIHNRQFFKLPVVNNGQRLNEHQLLSQLQKIVDASPAPDDCPVGILTAQNRSVWAKNYKRLDNDVTNRVILNEIATAISVVCLDEDLRAPDTALAVNENQSMSMSAINALHGGGSGQNSSNRWFDKTMQFVVSRDGSVGCCYEHSAAEGPPAQSICNRIIEDSELPFDWDSATSQINNHLDPPRHLKWKINEKLTKEIVTAQETLDACVTDTELKVIQFRSFGKSVPKKHRLSPDAFFQIALQLAYYRIHNHIAPTYETAGTRTFKKGRTETIRAGSMSALKFCKAMKPQSRNVTECRNLLIKAIDAHVKYTKQAVAGQGVDRHLLGLKLIALESKIPLPEIYRDHGYNYSSTFKLSTSQIPSPHDTVAVFGPATPDGYGVCYNPMEDRINVAITACNSNPETQAGRLAAELTACLEEMHALLLVSKL